MKHYVCFVIILTTESMASKLKTKNDMKLQKKLFIILIALLLILYFVYSSQNKAHIPQIHTERDKIKLKVPERMSYYELVTPPVYKNLKMIGLVKKTGVSGRTEGEQLKGMVLRTLRFQNITQKAEKKYHLPENIILAMIMQESGGADLLPNSSDDGGLGLCHMQPLLAAEFGLKTYKNCDELVCRKHGKELREIIEEHNFNRKLLLKYDDRFHPILNIDAAARMLAYYMAGEQTQPSPEATAIYGYAGSRNFAKYYKNVKYYKQIISDEEFIDKVREEFNQLNTLFTINGKPANFDDYIEAHQETNRNYGLDFYR